MGREGRVKAPHPAPPHKHEALNTKFETNKNVQIYEKEPTAGTEGRPTDRDVATLLATTCGRERPCRIPTPHAYGVMLGQASPTQIATELASAGALGDSPQRQAGGSAFVANQELEITKERNQSAGTRMARRDAPPKRRATQRSLSQK